MTLLLALLLVAATAVLYEPSLHNYFVNYDDPNYVVENAHVNTGLSWANIAWAFKTTSEDNWHPLTWVAHMAVGADIRNQAGRPSPREFALARAERLIAVSAAEKSDRIYLSQRSGCSPVCALPTQRGVGRMDC